MVLEPQENQAYKNTLEVLKVIRQLMYTNGS